MDPTGGATGPARSVWESCSRFFCSPCPWGPAAWVVATVMALAGLFLYEDNFVRAGQALPIS